MKTIAILFKFALLLLLLNCSRFLEEKSDSSLATPETLADNQALLDRYGALGSNSTSGEISADDIYVTEADFNTMPYEAQKRLYTWQPNYVSLSTGNDWESCYGRINIFNTVLFNLKQYQIGDSDNVEGQALVLRASVYLEAASLWCVAYDSGTAGSRLGLPLRLDPDMNVLSVRATLQETYAQILADLHRAVTLLPTTQLAVSRPSKVTALGYLARTYLYMGDYPKALLYGQEALSHYNTLMDFNALNPTAAYPIKDRNVEVLLPTSMAYSPFLATAKAKINNSFYQSYDSNDLRKSLYFKILANGEILFKGNYSGSSGRMTCLATDELYLTVAEAQAYLDDPANAMLTLNQLLSKRWKTGTFIPFTASSSAEALQIIRTERRKEILFRGLRWADLKRYNREGANITLTKIINGQVFSLAPNDLRYAIAIPEDIIVMTGMVQNDR